MEPHVIGQDDQSDRVSAQRKNRLKALPPDTVEVDGQRYSPHPNGGGLVAITARVAHSVFVGPDAQVRDRARVSGQVEVTGRAVIEGYAIVTDECSLSGDARVSDHAVLEGNVTLVKHACVGGNARLNGILYIGYFAYIGEDSRIRGHLQIE